MKDKLEDKQHAFASSNGRVEEVYSTCGVTLNVLTQTITVNLRCEFFNDRCL